MKDMSKDFYAEFNDMIIDIGTKIFDLQLLQGRYITDLLRSLETPGMECELTIPLFNGDGFSTVHVNRVFYDPEDDMVKVDVTGYKEMILVWSDVDIASQNEILQIVHHQCMAEKTYRDINGDDKRYYV